ncbi:hypothetical protein ACJRO7_010015 [Eucalyptus globulus]|uniref:Uncharacterized protein n=1 Tax=Eucalyptus globulus TaxID=34317 RepID=A0ABD3LBB9_EUCGL
MWRGREWKSSFPTPEVYYKDYPSRVDRACEGSPLPVISEQDEKQEVPGKTSPPSVQENEVYGVTDADSILREVDGNKITVGGKSSEAEESEDAKSTMQLLLCPMLLRKNPRPWWKQRNCTMLRQAVENGSALILSSNSLDVDIAYQRAVAFAKTAPPGPIFRH